MSVLRRNNVQVRGLGERAMLFVHGFGGDQTVWRYIAPSFEHDFVTVLFDQVGSGGSHRTAYSPSKYSTLTGYANDVLEIGYELELHHAVIVGHCCGAMIAALACLREPDMFTQLIMIGPSGRYLDDVDGYRGGFSEAQVKDMLAYQESDHPGWSARMAPLFMGNPDRPELTRELLRSYEQMDASIAQEFLRATFYSDFRSELAQVTSRTLILQSQENCVVPDSVAQDVRQRMTRSKLVFLSAKGHFPHLSAPAATLTAMSAFLKDAPQEPSRWRSGDLTVRDFIRAGTSLLDVAQGGPPDREVASSVDDTLDELLARVGELTLHMGRYDMYLVTLQDLITHQLKRVEEPRLSVRTRGDYILQLLAESHPLLYQQFESINLEFQSVLERHEIMALKGALIPGLQAAATRTGWKRLRHGANWFDKQRASSLDHLDHLERVERDILKVVSLCFRVTSCALAFHRAAK